jgi:hypothetical protein
MQRWQIALVGPKLSAVISCHYHRLSAVIIICAQLLLEVGVSREQQQARPGLPGALGRGL